MKENYFINGIKFALGILFVFSIFGFVYAVGFHNASEVLSGTFNGNYSFINGNIGIGTNNPQSELDVNGTLKASSLDIGYEVVTQTYAIGEGGTNLWIHAYCGTGKQALGGSCHTSDGIMSAEGRIYPNYYSCYKYDTAHVWSVKVVCANIE